MSLRRKNYVTRNEKTLDFIIGILGWHVINLAMLLGLVALSALSTRVSINNAGTQGILAIALLACECLPLLINLAGLIYFAGTRYWIALGALAALGFYLVLAVLGALVLAAVCFISYANSSGLGR
jgi:hypothetical protein